MAASLGSPSPLQANVKEYFRKPNAITKGLNPQEPSIYQKYLELVFPALRGKKVLDVGAGKGRLSIPLAINGSEVTALDLSSHALEELASSAKMRGVDVKVLQGDAESLDVPDELMDAVLCIETLVHVPNISKALGEFNRVLKGEGILVVSVTLPLSLSGWLNLSGRERFIAPLYSSRIYQDYFRQVLGRAPRTGREIRENEIVHALKSTGFTLLYKFRVLSRFLFIIAQKTMQDETGFAWSAGCPYIRLYPDAQERFCMTPRCERSLPPGHNHMASTDECACAQHFQENDG